MDGTGLPEDVRALIAQHISSVAQLEVLLLLHGNDARSWTAAEVARELRIDAGSAHQILADLLGRGFLAAGTDRADALRYAPTRAELASGTPALATCYRERRVAVISLIFSKPPDPLRQFAEAFRFKKGTD